MSARFDLLLAGAGHAHLGVLRRWAEPAFRPSRPTGRIGLLSADGHAWDSGMLPGLLSGHPPALRRRALKHLARRGVRVQEHCPVEAIVYEQLLSHGRSVWQGHRLIVASGASALPWLANSGLACDEQGFVQINAQLQSTSHSTVCAVGDCASLPHSPHNGVYAVRQGPVLAQNLAALLCGRPLQTFHPQRRALALLATGDGGALASWAGLTGEGSLLGHWKDHLDRGFMQRHRIP